MGELPFLANDLTPCRVDWEKGGCQVHKSPMNRSDTECMVIRYHKAWAERDALFKEVQTLQAELDKRDGSSLAFNVYESLEKWRRFKKFERELEAKGRGLPP